MKDLETAITELKSIEKEMGVDHTKVYLSLCFFMRRHLCLWLI